jgi:branched-chain amino acid transport system permease protein
MKKLHLAAVLAIVLVLLAVPPFLKNYGIYLFTYWLVFVIATMGLNLTIGYAGQKSLGHAAFFGIGAYTVAILMKAGFSWWLGLPVAIVGCFAVGLALGFPGAARADHLPGLRHAGLQHRHLAGDAQRGVADRRHLRHQQHRPAVARRAAAGQAAGLLLLRAGVAVVLGALLWRLLHSPWGKAFTALRDNPIRAESLGVNIRHYTLLSFAIGAVVCRRGRRAVRAAWWSSSSRPRSTSARRS